MICVIPPFRMILLSNVAFVVLEQGADEDVRMLLSLIKEQHEQGGSLQTFSESCMWTLLTSAEAACNHRLASILSRAAHRSGSTSKRVHTEIAAEEAQYVPCTSGMSRDVSKLKRHDANALLPNNDGN